MQLTEHIMVSINAAVDAEPGGLFLFKEESLLDKNWLDKEDCGGEEAVMLAHNAMASMDAADGAEPYSLFF